MDKICAFKEVRKSLGNKVIKETRIDKTNFSGNECIDYFMLRSDELQDKMDKIFPGEYKFKDYGNEHIFELPTDKYSVQYSVDNDDTFKVIQISPKSR